MKRVLLISFDLIREEEVPIPLSIASILSYLKSSPFYGSAFDVDHLPVNILNRNLQIADIPRLFSDTQWNQYSFIAISCFVWNESLTNPLLRYIRDSGFTGKIVLGGGQITYTDKDHVKKDYPEADVFVSGYAEKSLLDVILAGTTDNSFYNSQVDFKEMPSPYLTNHYPINAKQNMIRWETKRGCPYRCSFCSHRNLQTGKVDFMLLDKVYAELALFKEKKIRKVNVLDPIFNVGKEYLAIMNEIQRLSFSETRFSVQSKIELLSSHTGQEFLKYAESDNIHLEFGLQTIISEEYEVVQRSNDVEKVTKQLKELKHRNVSYEVSLIYGLPNQTVESFKKSIDFLRDAGCGKITAWPLMLLKGTKLYSEKSQWNLKEQVLGDYGIPLVTSGNTFTRDDWEQMKFLADNLNTNQRIN